MMNSVFKTLPRCPLASECMQHINAVIDSGSTYSLMSNSLAEKFVNTRGRLERLVTVLSANGRRVTCTEVVEGRFSFGTNVQKHNVSFLVHNKLPCSTISYPVLQYYK